ncbi:MAG: beta-propeller fold lactonase family protein [Smithella sp.]
MQYSRDFRYGNRCCVVRCNNHIERRQKRIDHNRFHQLANFTAATGASSSVSKFAYTANSGSNNISVYTINQTTGALTYVTSAATGSYPVSVTVDASEKFAYAANYGDNTISVYTINQTTGALTLVTTGSAGAGPQCVTTTTGAI